MKIKIGDTTKEIEGWPMMKNLRRRSALIVAL